MKILFAIVLVVVVSVIEAKLPPFFKKCEKTDKDFEECLTKSANDGWQEFIKGNPTYYIASMSPLTSVSMSVNVNDTLKGQLKNGTFSGFEGVQFKSIRADFEKKRFDISFTQPIFNLYGDYEVSGKILDRPIEGTGIQNITYYDGTYDYFFDYELKEKKDQHYIDIKNCDLKMVPKKIDFHLGNLFGGDVKLGEEMNDFLNKNSHLVQEDIRSHIGLAIAKVYSGVLSDFFKKVSMEELF